MHTRVEPAFDAGDAAGAIWSPADHTPDALDDLVQTDWGDGFTQAIDPQLYVAPLVDANPKKLGEHDLFPVPMRARDFAARNLLDLTDRLIRFQAERPVTHILSPTVAVPSMGDRWAQVAADLANTSIDVWSGLNEARPLLISVAVQESLLADRESVDALLDELTTYECDGFYLLLEIDPGTDPAEAAVLLERALYITYTLAILNEYTVWIGYAGLSGRAYRAAGAEATAAGWWQKLNWFSPYHWQASGGGRQPRPRIYLESIIGSLLIDAELERISRHRADATLYADVLAGAGELATEFLQGRAFDGNYGRPEMTGQLLAVCAALDGGVSGDPESDMRDFLDAIVEAEELLTRIRDVVQLTASGARDPLAVWQMGVTALGNRLGFNL